jgi:FtsZ-binding cell division protein ZapB
MNCLIESVEGIPISQQMEIEDLADKRNKYQKEMALSNDEQRKKELQGFIDAWRSRGRNFRIRARPNSTRRRTPP